MSDLLKLHKLTALFDADSIVYMAGFACEKKDKNTGEVEVEPIENCFQIVKTIVEGTLELFNPDAEHRIFIGGKNNFRFDIATIQPYKGNRDQAKPHYYDDVRTFLVERYDAEIVDDIEADDKVCMLQWAAKDKSTCIVGVDKDLLGCPGHHYNWKKKEYKYQTLHEANLHFLAQLIEGDRTDNIRGIDGYGPVKAAKLIAKCKGDIPMIKKEIEQLYREQHGDAWASALDETARLLFMLRSPGKTWSSYV